MLTFLLPLTRLKILLLANAALQVLDGYVTGLGVARGFVEGNPLVRWSMESLGQAPGLIAVKLLALAFLYLLYRRGHHRLVEPGLAYLAVVYLTMAVIPWTVVLARTPG
ncbi:MAG: DUF5658 family protein [Thermodesulfobacteriota bacterium]